MVVYRSVEQEATGYTTARLMFGWEVQLPLDLATVRPAGEDLPEAVPEYVAALQRTMKAMRGSESPGGRPSHFLVT